LRVLKSLVEISLDLHIVSSRKKKMMTKKKLTNTKRDTYRLAKSVHTVIPTVAKTWSSKTTKKGKLSPSLRHQIGRILRDQWNQTVSAKSAKRSTSTSQRKTIRKLEVTEAAWVWTITIFLMIQYKNQSMKISLILRSEVKECSEMTEANLEWKWHQERRRSLMVEAGLLLILVHFWLLIRIHNEHLILWRNRMSLLAKRWGF
jgi:hypothetical protein